MGSASVHVHLAVSRPSSLLSAHKNPFPASIDCGSRQKDLPYGVCLREEGDLSRYSLRPQVHNSHGEGALCVGDTCKSSV